MSEWGRVAFYYDFERTSRRGKQPERVKGVVSKAYKYIGALGMFLHAYNGIQYFLNHKDDPFRDYGIALSSDWYPIGRDWVTLSESFDVFLILRK